MRTFSLEEEGVEDNQKVRDLQLLSKLTRIFKSGLYAVLEIVYVFWVGATFALSGWLAGLRTAT